MYCMHVHIYLIRQKYRKNEKVYEPLNIAAEKSTGHCVTYNIIMDMIQLNGTLHINMHIYTFYLLGVM